MNHPAEVNQTRSCSILHDFLLVSGGAERLVCTLSSALSAPLVVGFLNPEAKQGLPASNQETHALGRFLHSRLARYFVNAWRFGRIDLSYLNKDVVVYSGVIAPMAVHRQPRGRRIYYCHSPPRFLYDLRRYYSDRSNWLGRLGLWLLDRWLRPRYEQAVRAMDVVVANSENVRQRLRRYLGVDAVVVHPPIDIDRYRWIESGDYFLSLARLEDFKRVDLIVEAFKCMPEQRLVVASGGSQEPTLRILAAGCDNISFTSWLTDDDLASLVGRCRAVIYIPIDEDFGMSPVEAMAAGKPVIGVAEGGMLETVSNGESGILMSPDLNESKLAEVVSLMTNQRASSMRQACELRARSFSRQTFIDRMRKLVHYY